MPCGRRAFKPTLYLTIKSEYPCYNLENAISMDSFEAYYNGGLFVPFRFFRLFVFSPCIMAQCQDEIKPSKETK